MPITLTDIEARILGSLIEKSAATPESYPLSLNSLTNACNQKSSRDPVMALDEATVARAVASLQSKDLIFQRNEPGSRVIKFMHKAENLLQGGNSKEIATLCVLLLRGPQTVGEIKTRTDRLCEFENTAEVESVLLGLMERSDGSFVSRLPRQSGQKEARYMHLFGETPAAKPAGATPSPNVSVPPKDSLQVRVENLEKRMAALEATFPPKPSIPPS